MDTKPAAPRRFALIGAAGYVAPRHMKAIRDTGNVLVAALDPNDSVGVIDSYFPDADFFVEFERYDRHIDMLRRKGQGVNYVSICSPNYLHDAHVRHALHNGANAICEKPLVLNPWNLDALQEAETQTGQRAYSILQLRLHPAVQALRERIAASGDTVHDVDVTYITSRGHWYFSSWKSREEQAGGVATNIGVHLFDMLGWVFGELQNTTVHLNRPDCAAGYLEFKRARVRWFLSVNAEHLPKEVLDSGKRTYRAVEINKEAWEFSEGFGDLHTASYAHILAGQGFGVEEARPSIETVSRIRNEKEAPLTGVYHPACKSVQPA